MLLAIASWQGRCCWSSQAGWAWAAGHRKLEGQMLLVVATWKGRCCWSSLAGRGWCASKGVRWRYS